ncbi:hypothetical protein [Agathobaculum sp. Marseille-P7918]|uniref:hypothetical protein n=1 Tax=Agathobaculum sp. Marseille-P7918 TaxID=2479843 RepID=UPI0035629786
MALELLGWVFAAGIGAMSAELCSIPYLNKIMETKSMSGKVYYGLLAVSEFVYLFPIVAYCGVQSGLTYSFFEIINAGIEISGAEYAMSLCAAYLTGWFTNFLILFSCWLVKYLAKLRK